MVQQAVNKVRNLIVVSFVSIALFGCAGASDLEDRMGLAETKYQKAKDVGFSWRANRLALEDARVALAAGDEQRAATMIEEAIKLADASLAQAEREAEEWGARSPFAR